jgi:ABC-type amino acid transport substrate-binding protein
LQEYLKKQGIDVSVKVYASYPEAIDGMRDGTVAAVSASEINLKLFGVKGMLILPDRFLPSRYCVEIRKELGAFVDAVNDTITDMENDGTLDALMTKWSLVDYSTLD